MIRHLASRPDQRIGSLFFNPGWPGDSGVAAVVESGEALDAMTGGRFDIVGWDIRGGAGASAPVLCFGDPGERASFWEGLPVPTTRADERRYLPKTIALAQRCGARNGELLAHISTVCADSPARHPARAWPYVVDRLEAVSRIGGPVVGWINAACASWPTPSADRYTGPWNATTRNPILLIGTRFDPNTPIANAARAERRVGNAVLLTHDGYGHLSTGDPSTCVIQATGQYLIDLTPTTRDGLPLRPPPVRPRLRPTDP